MTVQARPVAKTMSGIDKRLSGNKKLSIVALNHYLVQFVLKTRMIQVRAWMDL